MSTEKQTYEKLPPEFKEKWIAALRSGEYNQASRCLFDGDGYCCLGVACSIIGSAKSDLMNRSWVRDFMAPDIPKQLIGDRANLVVKVLSEMNDQGDMAFPEIADWIDANL